MHRLHYERFGLLFAPYKLVLEVIDLSRKNPSLWEHIEVILEDLEHPHQISAEIVLSCKLVHPWEVVNPLIALHLREHLRSDATSVAPVQVPVGILILNHLESEMLASSLHHHIPSLYGAEIQVLLLLLFLLVTLCSLLAFDTLLKRSQLFRRLRYFRLRVVLWLSRMAPLERLIEFFVAFNRRRVRNLVFVRSSLWLKLHLIY